jgi:sulfur-carrier protein
MPKVKTDSQGRLLLRQAFLPILTPIAYGHRILWDVREMMRVRVKLFASLVRYFDDAAAGVPFEIEVAEGATLGDLVNRLELPHEEVKVFFVNGRACPIGWSLKPNDEVGIFPLVAGG